MNTADTGLAMRDGPIDGDHAGQLVRTVVQMPQRGLSALLAELVADTGCMDAASPWALLDVSLRLEELRQAWHHHERRQAVLLREAPGEAHDDTHDADTAGESGSRSFDLQQADLLRGVDDLHRRARNLVTGGNPADRDWLAHDLHLRVARLAARAWQRFGHVERSIAPPLARRLSEPARLRRVMAGIAAAEAADREASCLLARWTAVATGEASMHGLPASAGAASRAEAVAARREGVTCH